MHIGIDFDNTIVCYDGVFYRAATEKGLIPQDCCQTKNGVRQFFRDTAQDEEWTRLQGYVYGCCMQYARLYDGVIVFLNWLACDTSHTVSIISHKTKYPVLGPEYDLRQAARKWMEEFLFPHIKHDMFANRIHFCEEQSAKIEKITSLGCSCFIDDLPDIFLSPMFPAATQKILFDPKGIHMPPQGGLIVSRWDAMKEVIQAGSEE